MLVLVLEGVVFDFSTIRGTRPLEFQISSLSLDPKGSAVLCPQTLSLGEGTRAHQLQSLSSHLAD